MLDFEVIPGKAIGPFSLGNQWEVSLPSANYIIVPGLPLPAVMDWLLGHDQIIRTVEVDYDLKARFDRSVL